MSISGNHQTQPGTWCAATTYTVCPPAHGRRGDNKSRCREGSGKTRGKRMKLSMLIKKRQLMDFPKQQKNPRNQRQKLSARKYSQNRHRDRGQLITRSRSRFAKRLKSQQIITENELTNAGHLVPGHYLHRLPSCTWQERGL